MAPRVESTDDPDEALRRAGSFLRSRPVEHNLILTLLHERIRTSVPGRYWTVSEGDEVHGVVFRSPTGFPALVTPMGPEGALAAADAIGAEAAQDPGAAEPARRLVGVSGEAGTAARFAGRYTEHLGLGADVSGGQRLYRLDTLRAAGAGGPGAILRPAGADDAGLVLSWTEDFAADIGEPPPPADATGERLRAGRVYLLEVDGAAVSMVAHAEPVAGVARVIGVFTPAPQRCRGHSQTAVTRLSGLLLERGLTPVLYADLANPVSNRLYRRIGYRSVNEVVRYRFTDADSDSDSDADADADSGPVPDPGADPGPGR